VLYSVVVIMAIGTSLIAPLLLKWLGRDLPLSEHERKRLEEAKSDRIFHLRAPKFLVATGGGATADTLVKVASRFCKAEGATLNVTHVEDPANKVAKVDEHLEDLRKLAALESVALVVSKPANADVAAGVLGEAKGKDVLLVGSSLVAPLRDGPLARILLESPCHAVAFCVPKQPEGGRFQKLMVPVDGTVFSRAAVEFALHFAKHEKAKVELVEVVVPGPGDVKSGPNVVRYLSGAEADERKRAVETSLASVLAEAHEPVSIHVMRGPDQVRALHAHAQGNAYDLLVLGAERQASEVHVLSGQGTEKLLDVGYAVAVVVPRL
jgi:nucleotide-binding universal stress UspA family protein